MLEAQAELGEAMDEAFKEMKKVLLKNVTTLSPDDLPDIKFDRDHGKLFVENKYVLNHIFKGRKLAEFMGVGNSFTNAIVKQLGFSRIIHQICLLREK